jgi:hypothetical protein
VVGPAGYDLAVMLGVTLVYVGVLGYANVPRGMWRFSGFAEVKRLLFACAAAGIMAAAGGAGARPARGAAGGAGAASGDDPDGPVHGAGRLSHVLRAVAGAAGRSGSPESRRAV